MTLRWKIFLLSLGFLLSTESQLAAEKTWGGKDTATKLFGSDSNAPGPEKPKQLDEKKVLKKEKGVCEKPLRNAVEAAACIEHQLVHEHATLYSFAQDSGHLGNVSDCSKSKNAKSYLSSDNVLFVEALTSLHNTVSCSQNKNDLDAYYCKSTISSSKTLACSKGNVSTKIGWVIGKSSAKLATFNAN